MDWETRSPWIELMSDIKAHFTFMHPDEAETLQGDASQVISPIKYTTLRCEHLPQIHQILQATFWDGIDVSDCLQYSPKQTTIIAVYKQLVVGCAFLSSPQETYLTYLAVRPGWEGANIATCMLYHLISRNPNKDITLHVSIKNPAMLLYNRFGFKAEEFIVGFYDEYMDTKNKPAKNAFRLRLRR
ncbi:hypothetical protein C8Q75DRAFT_366841 [Abortiporus biennis]|nr:hypothetical protein C8Q75DRAFT_366841 [Abortiporus biennis]